jgi:hypothetical protein
MWRKIIEIWFYHNGIGRGWKYFGIWRRVTWRFSQNFCLHFQYENIEIFWSFAQSKMVVSDRRSGIKTKNLHFHVSTSLREYEIAQSTIRTVHSSFFVQRVPPKYRLPFTNHHGVISGKDWIFKIILFFTGLYSLSNQTFQNKICLKWNPVNFYPYIPETSDDGDRKFLRFPKLRKYIETWHNLIAFTPHGR